MVQVTINEEKVIDINPKFNIGDIVYYEDGKYINISKIRNIFIKEGKVLYQFDSYNETLISEEKLNKL